ncbi:MAG TPA: TonB-dependent receptor [Terriglobales bacterium]|nr:TonB-dependent receptor [Terriglobales bacterium]
MSSLFSQTPDTATILGQVSDPAHALVPGAQVTVTNSLTGLQRTTVTDGIGKFSLAGLPVAGNYRLTASKSGFADASVEDLTLVGGRTANISLQLNIAAGATAIDVTGVAGGLLTDEPQLGERVSAVHAQNTPLLNLRISYLPLLNSANRPALNQGDVFMNQNLFTTNGAGRRQTSFEVDGSNANDSWGRQTMFTNLPLASVQEMTVLENSFSSEYGATTGGVVNVVTKTGGNNFHGEILGLFRPAETSAKLSGFTPSNAPNGNAITSDSLRQTSAALGGPIGSSQRTHFFASGEYTWQNRVSPVTSPVAPGPFEGHYRGWLAFARFDRQINDRNTLFLRSNADSFHDTNPNGAVGGNNLASVDRVFKRRTYSAEVGETAVLNPSLVNNARGQFQLASPITQFAPVIFSTQYTVPIAGVGNFVSGTSQSAQLQNRQYDFSDTLAADRGRHQLRFGASVLHAHNGGNGKEFGGPSFLGAFTYKTCNLGLAACESPSYLNDISNVNSYTQSYGNATYTVDDTLWAVFAQDDFHLRRDLTLNLGLRYERQTFTDARKDFAPRVGFVYNLAGKTVVRGGFGIYYAQVVDNAQTNYALSGPTGFFNFTAQAGQVGFPATVASAPLPAFPPGAQVPVRNLYIRPGRSVYYDQFFPTSVLIGYPDTLLNPYSEQWTIGIQHELAPNWLVSMDYVGSHTLRVVRPLDMDAPASVTRFITSSGTQSVRSAQAANCTRPLWVAFYTQAGRTCDPTRATNPQPAYAQILSDVNNGYGVYHAFDTNLSHRFNDRFLVLASYTWSHATNNVDPDVPGQNPNDPNVTGRIEYGNAIFDQRHRFVLSGFFIAPLKITLGGVATLASGLPYNLTTGANNFGDPGATIDRPLLNGAIVGRNTGRGSAIYDVSPMIERPFNLGSERVQMILRGEAFNVFNHANFVGFNGVFGNGTAPPVVNGRVAIGQPLVGITNQLPARSLQFQARLNF